VTGFPALLPKSGLDEMNLMITDEDPKCHLQIGAAKQLGVLPNVTHRLCCWHKINRNYSLKSRSKTVTEKDTQFTRLVEKWLHSFTKTDIESREEEIVSMEMFEHFLSQAEVTAGLKLFTKDYWEKVRSMCDIQTLGRLDVWTFGHLTLILTFGLQDVWTSGRLDA
jgi:hypothetical protein